MQDEQIITLYNERDEQAIVETDAKYGKYCMSIAQNILQNMQDSEECVNDTWLHTWNAIPPAHPFDLKTFVGKITRNLSINRFKFRTRAKRGGGEAVLAIDELCEVAAPDSDIESQLQKEEFARILNEFLHGLSERDCNVFIRRYYFVDSVEDIADRYSLRYDNVLKILSRARKKLRQSLEGEGYSV